MITFSWANTVGAFIRLSVLFIGLIASSLLPAKATNVLLLGDSLSASYGMQPSKGWAFIAQQTLRQQYPSFNLLNFSASGETTSGGKARLNRLLGNNDVDVLWIELGGNDGLRGYPINTISNNLSAMIEVAQAQGIDVILTQIQIPPNLGKRYTKMFSGVYTVVATDKRIPLMPFFIESVAGNPELMQKDQIHPNELAQPIIANVVVKYFEQYLSSLRP